MIKWQYKVEAIDLRKFNDNSLSEYLNSLAFGLSGWELVAALQSKEPHTIIYHFKRPIS